MKLSPRESGLALGAGLAILVALTVWVGAPRVDVWRERRTTLADQTRRIEVGERLIASRGDWDRRLAAVRERLSSYPADMDVTADYLKILERVAKETTLTLGQRKPQKEQPQGECFEMPVDCTWEGDLNSLVRFLFALEQEPVTMSIEELSVSLVAGGAGRLKGNFTLMCIYARAAPAVPAPAKFSPAVPIAAPPAAEGSPLANSNAI